MKTLLILIFSIIITNGCIAQQIVSLDDNTITLSVPKEAVLITKTKAASHLLNELKGGKAAVNEASNSSAEKIFLIKDKLLFLNAGDASVSPNYLNEIKRGLDEMFQTDTTYKSHIKKYSDKSILVISYVVGNLKHFKFYSYNNKFNKAAAGSLRCKKSDDADGSMLLKQILESLKYSN